MRDVYSQIGRMAGLEAAGLFWIGAELAILFMMAAARRHIETRPLPPRLDIWGKSRGSVRAWTGAFLALAAAILGRHLVYALAPVPEAVRPLLASRAHVHMVVWSAFITGWVALELAIVYQGFHGYRALKSLLPRGASRAVRPNAAMLCLAGVFLLHAAAPAQTMLAEVKAADQVYYNAMYLYLRLAGVVWILAEWAAALILWRTYALLASAAVRMESANA